MKLLRGGVPNDEVRVGLLHDEFLWTNVLLLPRVDNVPLLQDLHCEGFVLVALELNLRRVTGRVSGTKTGCWYDCEGITVDGRRSPPPAQRGQIRRLPECRWCWSRRGWGWRKMHSPLRICGDGGKQDRIVEGSEMSWTMKEEIIHCQQPEAKYLCAHLFANLRGFTSLWSNKDVIEDVDRVNWNTTCLR